MQSCKSDAEQGPLPDDIWMNMEMLGEESASGLSWDQSGQGLGLVTTLDPIFT